MIVRRENEEGGFTFAVNIGTPEVLSEWQPLENWVENTPHEVLVSTAYGWCKDAFDKNEIGIHRGGYLFMLWFNSREAAAEFAQVISSQPYGKHPHGGGQLPVLEDMPPGAPNTRFRVMESIYAGQPWFEERYRGDAATKITTAVQSFFQ